jgi:hypothetical protein
MLFGEGRDERTDKVIEAIHRGSLFMVSLLRMDRDHVDELFARVLVRVRFAALYKHQSVNFFYSQPCDIDEMTHAEMDVRARSCVRLVRGPHPQYSRETVITLQYSPSHPSEPESMQWVSLPSIPIETIIVTSTRGYIGGDIKPIDDLGAMILETEEPK